MIEWLFVGIFVGLGISIIAGIITFEIAINAMIEIAQRKWEEEEEHKDNFKEYFHGNLRP